MGTRSPQFWSSNIHYSETTAWVLGSKLGVRAVTLLGGPRALLRKNYNIRTKGGNMWVLKRRSYGRLRRDLSLRLGNDLCWGYDKQPYKLLLQAISCHAAYVKSGLALSSLKSALSRSSAHFVGLTFIRQIVFYVTLDFVNQSSRVKQDDKRKSEVYVLYYHVFSINWKSLAQRCGLHKSFCTNSLYT